MATTLQPTMIETSTSGFAEICGYCPNCHWFIQPVVIHVADGEDAEKAASVILEITHGEEKPECQNTELNIDVELL